MRRSMLIGLLFHPGKQWSDRNQKIWPWCCCLLAMLRPAVIGAEQPMSDRALHVRNPQQPEIRLTGGKNLGILIAPGEQVWFGCDHNTRTCTGHVLVSSKEKEPKPTKPQTRPPHPEHQNSPAIFLHLKVRLCSIFLQFGIRRQTQ